MKKPIHNIGDKVTLLTQEKSIVYIVYAITYYKDRFAYTIWINDDYITCDEWQVEAYVPDEPIGFNTLTLETLGQ